jgi:site-specific recombinase XerD
LIVVLWRTGLRIQEALALTEADLDHRRGALLVRRGKGDAAARWVWTSGVGTNCSPGSSGDSSYPSVRCFCVIHGLTHDRAWSSAAAHAELRRTAAAAGVRRRLAPHQLRHAHAVELAREGVPLIVIQRQLGHNKLGITSVYLQEIDTAEIIETVHARRAPMISVSASLRL